MKAIWHFTLRYLLQSPRRAAATVAYLLGAMYI